MWTEAIETTLQKWGRKCQMLQLMCDQSASYYKRMEKWFGIPIIILGTITTSSIFIQINDCNEYKQLASGLLSLTFTLVSAIGKFVGYSELTAVFTNAARECDNLVFDIQEQLSRPRGEREPAYAFVTKVKQTLTKLKDTPPFPNRVVRQYMGKVDQHFRDIGIVPNDDLESGSGRATPDQDTEQVTTGDDGEQGARVQVRFHNNKIRLQPFSENFLGGDNGQTLKTLESRCIEFDSFYS